MITISRTLPEIIPELLPDHGALSFRTEFEPILQLGKGGCSKVFLTRDRQRGGYCAVKVPQEVRFVPYLQREAFALFQLQHPGIADFRDYRATPKGMPALILEYCEGFSLSYLLNQEGPLCESQTRQIGHALREILGYIHDRGMLHLDIKPENILLSHKRLKLLDFSSVEFLRSEYAFCQDRQTQGYEAPELLHSHRVSPASDFYSLGVTLCACLKGTSDPQVMNQMPFPRIGPELAGIIYGLLSEDPLERIYAARKL